MRIPVEPEFILDDLSSVLLNELDAHKIGLPDGGLVRVFMGEKRRQSFFTISMYPTAEVPQGRIRAPKLLQSLSSVPNRAFMVENAALFLPPEEKSLQITLDEYNLKSQSQILEEFLQAKKPKEVPRDDSSVDTLIIRHNPSKTEENTERFAGKDPSQQVDHAISESQTHHMENDEIKRQNSAEISGDSEDFDPTLNSVEEYEALDTIPDEIDINLSIAPSVQPTKPLESTDKTTSEDISGFEYSSFNEDDYHAQISIHELLNIRSDSAEAGVMLSPEGLDGFVYISHSLASQLDLFPGGFIGWEDPITRGEGMSPVKVFEDARHLIQMDILAARDSDIARKPNHRIVVFSMEPPIIKVRKMTLRPVFHKELVGVITLNYRNARSLALSEGEIVALSHADTNFAIYTKIRLASEVPDEEMWVDPNLINNQLRDEILLDIQKRQKKVLPLTKLVLKCRIVPEYTGNYPKLVSSIQNRVDTIRIYMLNYLISPGLKVGLSEYHAEFLFDSCRPALGPQEIGKIVPNSQIEVKFEGLGVFDTIILVDVTRSMQGQDIGAQDFPEIQVYEKFLSRLSLKSPYPPFKSNTYARRHHAASILAGLYILDKMSRKMNENIAALTFADKLSPISFQSGEFWLNTTSPPLNSLQSFFSAFFNQVLDCSGGSTNFPAVIPHIQKLLERRSNEALHRPTKFLLLTDGNSDDFGNISSIIAPICRDYEISLTIFSFRNLSLEKIIDDSIPCKTDYFDITQFADFIPLYRKISNTF